MLLLGILCTFLTVHLPKTKAEAQVNELTCQTDYWLTISCFLKSSAIAKRTQPTPYWLEFDMLGRRKKVFNCSLIEQKDGYSCTFNATLIQNTFMDMHSFNVFLCYLENGIKQSVNQISKYYPANHIKPRTPTNLKVNKVGGYYNFQWTSGYENHTYVKSLSFQYNLSYHKEDRPDKVFFLRANTTTFMIPEVMLEAGSQYIIKVCSKVTSLHYKGTSSDWSDPIKWNTPHTVAGLTSPLHSTAVITVLISLAMALTFLLLYPVARMKIRKTTWVASPYPYFQSLYQQHQGDFKDWVSKGKVQQTYSEEISTIDTITEITAVEQTQGKIPSAYFSFQYHTPYVGPSAEVWVPFQISDAHSVAGISCKDLDFLPEESADKEPMLCLTTFEPIAVEGFLSVEDLELSYEDPEPPETLTTIPKPACFTQNYCTLTNTSIGLIPTFITEPSKLLPDSQDSTLASNMQVEENTTEAVTLTLDSLQVSMEE